MVERLVILKVSACGLSDIGLVRQNNEDVWAEVEDLSLYLLADGMGGHQAGEIAAREAIDVFCQISQKALKDESLSLDERVEEIKATFDQVNSHVYKMGRANSELKGMGTTLCALLINDEGAIIAHVGDSRVYRLRHGQLVQITKDHSLVRELIELGQVSERQASDFVYKNIITRAIGTEPTVEPSVQILENISGDIYILCSDGLSDLLSLNEIEAIVKKHEHLSQSAKELVDASKAKGGHDNVTVVMVKVSESHEREAKHISR